MEKKANTKRRLSKRLHEEKRKHVRSEIRKE